MRTSAQGRLSRRLRWGRGRRVASPRGQNQEGSQMQEKTETSTTYLGTVVGLNWSTRRALFARTGRQQRLIHKGGWGATKIQGGLGEQERELKAKHVGVTHSVLLGKHLLRALSVLQLYRSGIQKTRGKTLPVLSTLWILRRPSVTG